MEFTGVAKDGSTIRFVDGKRYWWLAGLAMPAAVLASYGLYLSVIPDTLLLLTPLFLVFVLVPVLDAIVGEDPNNPPEEVVPAMARDGFYDRVAYIGMPVHYVLFFATAWLIATQEPPLWVSVALAYGIGMMNGNMINLGHELGHRRDRRNRLYAKLALGLSGYGHFTMEHNLGHHARVATPEDCASARMGESVYAFALRELPGAFMGGWRQEAVRLKRQGVPLFHWRNEILQVYALTALITAGLVAWLGWAVLPFIVVHHFISWFGLTLVNYIEHYGLLRQKRADGKYEPCAPCHSWNSNHVVSNLLLVQLQRHSDHHANPNRPYQALRNLDGIPQLPSGYPACILMASIPPLWFKVMDPKVMAWADGDIGRVNR